MARSRTVGPNGKGGWSNKSTGSKRATSNHRTQKAAQQSAHADLRRQGGGELITKGRNGQIRAKNTVAPGNDPRKSKG